MATPAILAVGRKKFVLDKNRLKLRNHLKRTKSAKLTIILHAKTKKKKKMNKESKKKNLDNYIILKTNVSVLKWKKLLPSASRFVS